MICRICGDEKDPKDFYKIKHFYKYHHSKIRWCRSCQRMWVEMKKQEEMLKQIAETRGTFCVKFD